MENIPNYLMVFISTFLLLQVLKLMKPKIVKYEFTVISGGYPRIDQLLEQYQKEGWEIAGNVNVTNAEQWPHSPTSYIPMKRKL